MPPPREGGYTKISGEEKEASPRDGGPMRLAVEN